MGGIYAIKEVKLKQGLSVAKIDSMNLWFKSQLDIQHKNVNCVFGYALEYNYLVIIEEFVNYGSIYSKLQLIIFPETVIQKYANQIMDGLSCLY